jgi:hypothetical protein
MALLPESHKQTILLQWKKKKVALAQRRSSLSTAPYASPFARTRRHMRTLLGLKRFGCLGTCQHKTRAGPPRLWPTLGA